jgi:hypothetical protein
MYFTAIFWTFFAVSYWLTDKLIIKNYISVKIIFDYDHEKMNETLYSICINIYFVVNIVHLNLL